jgi:hypothetical protein
LSWLIDGIHPSIDVFCPNLGYRPNIPRRRVSSFTVRKTSFWGDDFEALWTFGKAGFLASIGLVLDE